MSDGTHISWSDATWNPVTGCTKVSAGCDHCYIDRTPPFRMQRRRFDKPGIGGTTGVLLHPERLDQPKRWRNPRRIFVNSLSDLFHDDVPDEFLVRVFDVMANARQHVFQVLTKRPARMRSFVRRYVDGRFGEPGRAGIGHLPRWIWLGVSTEDQKAADLRVPILLDTPSAVRWISAEPLIGPIDLSRWMTSVEWPECWDDHEPSAECSRCIRMDWVVAGGESGPGARPMHPDWVRDLRDQCSLALVPFFFKQWGAWGLYPPKLPTGYYDWNFLAWSLANDGTLYEPGALTYPDGPRWGEAIRAGHGRAHLHSVYRVGKKAAGRELDGVVHDEYPQAVTP